MRVLMIVNRFYPYNGGTELSTKILFDGLRKFFKIDLITYGDLFEKNDKNIIRIYSKAIDRYYKNGVKKVNIFDLKEFSNVTNQILKYIDNYDIVWTNGNLLPLDAVKIWKYAKKKDKKVIHTIRDNYFLGENKLNNKLFSSYIKKHYLEGSKFVDIFMAPSKYTANKHFEFGNVKVVPNTIGYNFDKYEFNRLLLSKYDTFSTPRLIFVGRLSEEKGFHLFVKIINEIKKVKHINVSIVGDGILKNIIPSFVDYKGSLSHKETLEEIKKAHFLFLPSTIPESFGRTLIEANFNACLPLGTKIGAIPEIIGNDFCFNTTQEAVQKILNMDAETWFSKIYDFPKEGYQLKTHIKHILKILKGVMAYENTLFR